MSSCLNSFLNVRSICFQLDLPCSIPFYRWLLCEEQSLGLADLAFVAPEVQATLSRLHVLVKKRDRLQQDGSLDAGQKTEQVRYQLDYIIEWLY